MFYSPHNIQELLPLLQKADPNLRVIAGGTDLIIHLHNRHDFDADFLNVMAVEEFKGIAETDQEIWIGAVVTMTELCESALVKDQLTALYYAAYHLGSEQIRNRATLGGAIANASQSSDPSDVLFAYHAEVEIMDARGEKKLVPMESFITGREKTCLVPGEVVTRIRIPKRNRKSMFGKIGARKAVTIAKINCAVDYEDINGTMHDVRVYLGAVGIKPVEARGIEALLEGRKPAEVPLEELQRAGWDEVEKAIPTRPSRFYKRVAVEGLLEDVIGALQ